MDCLGFPQRCANVQRSFYRLGLTDSEKKFFSVPDKSSAKVFRIKDYNLGLLVCFEVEQQPWAHFQAGDVGSGPEGLSYIVGHDNRLLHKGPHAKSEGFLVRLNKVHGQTVVESVSGL